MILGPILGVTLPRGADLPIFAIGSLVTGVLSLAFPSLVILVTREEVSRGERATPGTTLAHLPRSTKVGAGLWVLSALSQLPLTLLVMAVAYPLSRVLPPPVMEVVLPGVIGAALGLQAWWSWSILDAHLVGDQPFPEAIATGTRRAGQVLTCPEPAATSVRAAARPGVLGGAALLVLHVGTVRWVARGGMNGWHLGLLYNAAFTLAAGVIAHRTLIRLTLVTSRIRAESTKVS